MRHILDCPCLDCAGRAPRLDDRDRGACVAVVFDASGNPSQPVANGGRWISERRPRDRNDEGPM